MIFHVLYIQPFKAMKSVFNRITPVIRPCLSNFTKLPPNQGICVWYIEVKFEFCAYYSYRVIAIHYSM